MNWRLPPAFIALALAALMTLGFASSVSDNNVFLPYIAGDVGPVVTPTATTGPTATATFQPTATTGPTATATFQPTPTPNPTQAPQDVVVLDNHSAYRDSIDALHIVGEVFNGKASNTEFVKITANLFDSNGQIVDTDFTYTNLDVLPAGEKTCFHSLFYPGPSDWSYYQFEVDENIGGTASTKLIVTQHSGSYNILDWYEVVGIIRNDTNQDAKFVKAIGTLYDQSGRVIGCNSGYVSADTLSPGQSSSFKITFTNAVKGSVGSYRLQTDGSLR